MAAEEEHKPRDEQQEPKIPVFTVLKNGAILKNIFIVHNTCSSNPPSQLNPLMGNQEEILIIGRHPDCNVMLTHPSISRFHLKILSNPSLQKLSVIDLSSVHGTWVSEKKIEPWERVELSEGDSLRIGGSSRVYRLHWIPLAKAYDFETPYVSALDELVEDETFVEAFRDENSFPIDNEPVEEGEIMIEMVQVEENEDENSFPTESEPVEEEEEAVIEIVQAEENEVENSFTNENEEVEEEETAMKKAQEEENEDYLFKENNETQSLDEVVECTSSLYTASLQVTVEEIQSAPTISESPVYLHFDENEEGSESSLKDVGEEKEIDYDDETLTAESEYLVYPTEEFSTLVSACGNSIPRLESSFVTDIMSGQQSPVISAGGAQKESYRIFGAESENLNSQIEEVVSDSLVSACDDYIHCYEPSFATHFTCERQSSVIPAERTERESYRFLIDHFDSSFSKGRAENQTPLRENTDTKESSFLASNLIGETQRENEHHDEKDLNREDLCAIKSLSRDRKQEISPAKRQPTSIVEFNSAYSTNVSPTRRLEETENQNIFVKDHHQRDVPFEHCPPCIEESVNSSFPSTEVAPEIEDEKENQTPQSVFAAAELPNLKNTGNSTVRLDKKPSFGSIWSRRGKPASAIQLRTGRNKTETMMADVDTEESFLKENFSRLKEDQEIFTPDKENFTPNTLLVKSLKKKSKHAGINQLQTGNEIKSITKENILCLSEDEEEIFTPDKENFTPNTFLLKSLKKKGILEANNSKPSRLSPLKAACSPTMHPKEDSTASPAKENRPLRVLQELKPVKRLLPSGNQARLRQEVLVNKRRQERVPCQSLAVNPVGKERSMGTTSTARSSLSANCARTVEKNITDQHFNNFARESKRTWTMVADITTLLNRESRNKLQLLQGLKGTRLIIPRMVIRELDCLRQRGSLFRRKTEACLVLEWIEQCMVETTSWIHVQSSAEDTRLTAPTPPASPRSPFSEGSGGFSYGTTSSLPFLRLGSLMEIVSPTTEDHILECALLCRKVRSDGQVVLLSSDITMKVKAMAEGLICETVQEFRESLINPFSERFLWANSSPRGQTWSVMDDVVLRERYNSCPLKKSLKGENAKGLKLILLHNSHYGQRIPIS